MSLSEVGNNNGNSHVKREFPMTDANFEELQEIAHRLTGIALSHHKKELVYSRLARRIRSLGQVNFDQYIEYLKQHEAEELSEFMNSITTNLTSFFREPHHFEFLKSTALPEIRSKHKDDKKVRVWSAGCSTGEEPYTIAMTLKAAMFPSDWDVRVLATDLDSNVLEHGRRGVYAKERIEGLEEAIQKKWFLKSSSQTDSVKVKPELAEMIRFNRLNLLEDWPMKGRFDIIFCRNVVIYFNKDTQKRLFDRYANKLNDGGYLIIGHSESLHNLTTRFESLGRTIYRKIS